MSDPEDESPPVPAARTTAYVPRRWRTTGTVTPAVPPPTAQLSVAREGDVLVVSPSGTWSLRAGLPSTDEARAAIDAQPAPRAVRFDAQALDGWDTSLIVAVGRIEAACARSQVTIDLSGLPAGARRLLESAHAADALTDAGGEPPALKLREALRRLRQAPGLMDATGAALLDGLDFLGCTAVALARTLLGRTHRLGLDLTTAFQQAGAGTLPILAFIALAGGGVLSLIATQQMERLGAALLTPNLVAIVIVRELAALMTGFALAGRLGSANAADLATMATGEEIGALRATGIDPFDLLVAPRVLALAVMGPLLVLYAIAFGLLGSVFVGVGLSDIPLADYLDRTREALDFNHALAGLIKGVVFGLVVGMAGCYHGLSSDARPGAVGRAVRAAVVTSILGVVAVDAAAAAFFKWIRF